MAAVQLSFERILSELQSIEDIASSYLESDRCGDLLQARSTLQNLRQHSSLGQQRGALNELSAQDENKPGSYCFRRKDRIRLGGNELVWRSLVTERVQVGAPSHSGLPERLYESEYSTES